MKFLMTSAVTEGNSKLIYLHEKRRFGESRKV